LPCFLEGERNGGDDGFSVETGGGRGIRDALKVASGGLVKVEADETARMNID
jgi:hypothetical protein